MKWKWAFVCGILWTLCAASTMEIGSTWVFNPAKPMLTMDHLSHWATKMDSLGVDHYETMNSMGMGHLTPYFDAIHDSRNTGRSLIKEMKIAPPIVSLERNGRLFDIFASIGTILDGTACATQGAFSLFTFSDPAVAFDECQANQQAAKDKILAIIFGIIGLVIVVAIIVFAFWIRKNRKQARMMKMMETSLMGSVATLKKVDALASKSPNEAIF